MTELQKLKEERKLIDEKIKVLSGVPVYKRCKIDVHEYPTDKPSRYFVAIKYQPIDGHAKYQTLFSSNDRDEVVKAIPNIIEELQGLYELATQGFQPRDVKDTCKQCEHLKIRDVEGLVISQVAECALTGRYVHPSVGEEWKRDKKCPIKNKEI